MIKRKKKATVKRKKKIVYPQVALIDEFLDLAKQYRKAYYDLPEPMRSWPRYFLFCHSIELVLKAYLAHAAGLTEKQLQDFFGHNIKNLLDQMWSVLECQYQS